MSKRKDTCERVDQASQMGDLSVRFRFSFYHERQKVISVMGGTECHGESEKGRCVQFWGAVRVFQEKVAFEI